MKFTNQAILTGIKESSGDFEGRKYSSTTFHLIVDVAESGSGRSIGQVTRPFKCGEASEFEKWKNWADKWPVGGLLVDCQFEVVAGSDNKSELKLLAIKPATPAPTAKAA